MKQGKQKTCIVLIAFFFSLQVSNVFASELLLSWNDGRVKESIVYYVDQVTDKGSKSFIGVSDRIAVFDNDGCLWSEKPLYFQFYFAVDRIKEMAPDHPGWKTTEPFASILKGDYESALAGGNEAILEIVMASHGGMTTDEFDGIVRDWLEKSRHPETGKKYTAMIFQPMIELLKYLRANEFKTFIVSGGGIDFLRVWAEEAYGIPPDQIVGSSVKTRFEIQNGRPVIVRLPEVSFINDKKGKPVGIHNYIGKHPVFAFGNSDGDLQMLQWTDVNDKKTFKGLVHHTDSEREWAYDRKSHVGKLDKALDEAENLGWTVVDMAKDWKVVYPAP